MDYTKIEWVRGLKINPYTIFSKRNGEVVYIAEVAHPATYSEDYEIAKKERESNTKIILNSKKMYELLKQLQDYNNGEQVFLNKILCDAKAIIKAIES